MDKTHYLYDIKANLEANGWEYDSTVDDSVRARQNGKNFTLNEHIRAMIFALLSNRTPWKRIKKKIADVDAIFAGYDPETIKQTAPSEYVKAIRKIKCGNQNITNQMTDLADNIRVLQNLEAEYGSVDAFLTSQTPSEIVKLLSSSKFPKTKLKQMGEALVWEYIRNVGIDGAKPDVHLRRFLGASRMGACKHNEATINEVYKQVDILSQESGLTKAGVDTIIWTFCAESDEAYGEICSAKPHCDLCPVRDKCNFSGEKGLDYPDAILRSIKNTATALGKTIDTSKIWVIDRGVPHIAPKKLPEGRMAVYTFIYNDEFLKIGKAGPNSNARYTSQHYNPGSAMSNLAKSLLDDRDMNNCGIFEDNVGEWIKSNCRRIDIEMDTSLGIFTLELVEAILHYKYIPKYEGFNSQR